MNNALLIYNARLLDEKNDGMGSVLISDGKILKIFKESHPAEEMLSSFPEISGQNKEFLETFDAEGLTLTPAFIDMHVHLRDPGLTQKEDLQSGLTACAHGGYGTVVAMPNTLPVISSRNQALEVMERGRKIGMSRLFQTVSITRNFEGSDTSHLDKLDALEIPVITEDGHDVLSSAVMLEGMKKASENHQIVSCHCEDVSLAQAARQHREKALEIMKKYNLSAWGAGDYSKVPEEALNEIDRELSTANELLALAEDIATERNIQIAKTASCHVHICHISTKKSIEYVRKAKKENCSVTAEATVHHLALTGDKEPEIRALVNPPLRHEEDRLSVIEGLADGTIDCIATDHAPHTAEDKAKGAPGFSGIETAYGISNKVLVKGGYINENRLSSLLSANPARLLKLKKGLLAEGYDADLVIVNSDEKWIVKPSDFYSKGKATPFEGMEACGRVKTLFLSGKKIF